MDLHCKKESMVLKVGGIAIDVIEHVGQSGLHIKTNWIGANFVDRSN